ncbi:PHP domain-containing protein [Luedemannella helvata]|uniref:Histidinol-phosphatase n=2 Tax=Luedemannella helvata TaxID=349315 RepID=A0ABP4X8H1_9ACTN
MERTCARAMELGLPAVAFTEHADYTPWVLDPSLLDGDHQHLLANVGADNLLRPPPIDLDGYLECLRRCRERFPDLRILSGVELGEPHWHRDEAARLLSAGGFDRVLGSLHCLPAGDRFFESADLYLRQPAGEVLRQYLAEVCRMVAGWEAFEVLAHLDYAIRSWPAQAGPFDPYAFEDELRETLRVLAGAGRVLEVNTRGPMHPEIVRWWREEGGDAVSFGSDGHSPNALAFRFAEAAAMVEAQGFRPGRHPYDFWIR